MTESTFDDVLNRINSSTPARKLAALIERTNLSADMKALLADLAKITVKVGKAVVAIGRSVIQFVFELVKAFPNITLGVLIALVLTTIVGALPLIGAILTPILTPLLLAVGIGKGALADMAKGDLGEKISNLTKDFKVVENKL